MLTIAIYVVFVLILTPVAVLGSLIALQLLFFAYAKAAAKRLDLLNRL